MDVSVVRRLGEHDAEQRAYLRRVDRAKAPLVVGEVVQEHAFLFIPGKLGFETALAGPEEDMHDAAPRVSIIEQPVAVVELRHDVSNLRGTSPSAVLSDPDPHFGRETCPSGPIIDTLSGYDWLLGSSLSRRPFPLGVRRRRRHR